jgi:NitT/TauT family transport system permease protein
MMARRDRLKAIAFWLTGLVLLVVVWSLLGQMGNVAGLMFPPPLSIAQAFAEGAANGRLATDTGWTSLRIVLGLALGAVPGMAVGLLMGWSSTARRWADPIIAAFHPMPKVALLPLIMIAFGIGELSKVVAAGVAAFFPVLINCMAGVRSISPTHFEVASNYGAGRLDIFRRVVWPGSLPLVLTGLRLGFNASVLVTIAVELVAARQGLGAEIWLAWQVLDTPNLYVGLLVIAALGMVVNSGLKVLTERLTPWAASDTE